jgi:hypothetical protein
MVLINQYCSNAVASEALLRSLEKAKDKAPLTQGKSRIWVLSP